MALREYQLLPVGYPPPNHPRNDPPSAAGRERSKRGGGGSLQTDRDDVPRGCSTGQVFIAGSFVRIPLLINDYPNSMIDRQYR